MKHYLRMNSRGQFAYDYRSGAYKNYKDVDSAIRWLDDLHPIVVELDTEKMTMGVAYDGRAINIAGVEDMC